MPNRYFTIHEIASLLDVPYRTVLRWVMEGKLYSAGKIDRNHQIPADSFLAFLNSNKRYRKVIIRKEASNV